MNKKLKKTLQCTMCAVLSFGMVVCNSSFVEAKKIKKQESVYVNAAADGSGIQDYRIGLAEGCK